MLKEATEDMPQGVIIIDSGTQDKITNNEVLQSAKMDGMEAMLMRVQLRLVGHVQRMSDNRMP